MKIRIFTSLKNGVYHARIHTEDWSENARELMKKYGEPEINLGGFFNYSDIQDWDWNNNNSGGDAKNKKLSGKKSEVSFTDDGFRLDDNYARIMTESPFTKKFDIRNMLESVDGDYESARIVTQNMTYMWTRIIRDRIFQAVTDLKNNSGVFNSKEEIFDFSQYNGNNNNGGEIVNE